jgi:hypothetical protein
MQAAPARLHNPITISTPAPPTAWYSVLGIPIAVTSDEPDALLRVDETYAAFRAAPAASGEPIALWLLRAPGELVYIVSDAAGSRRWPAYQDALLDLFDRLVHALLVRLLAQGVYVIHAGAVVFRGAALAIAGRSGQGKTTLTLGLLRRGLGLLSDEFAVVEPAEGRRLLPYHRSLHVRPGTPELIPELRFLHQRPRRQLGGGSEWAVTPQDLDRVLPGCLAAAAPLRYVLLLEGTPRVDKTPAITPVPAALAALELLRGAWAASVDFDGTLAQVGQLLDPSSGSAEPSVACARLRAGALEPTLDTILAWLEAHRD